MRQKVVKSFSIINAVAMLVAIAAPFFAVQNAQAAGLANLSVKIDRMAAGVATGGTVCASPITVDTETLVKVTFPSDFTVNATATNWTVSVTNIPSGTTAWPGILTATDVTSKSVTFPSDDLSVGTTYCFNFLNNTTLTNATAGTSKIGSVTTQKAGPTTIDSSSFALTTITDDTITVTAAVPPTFAFSIAGGNTDNFTGDLTTGVVSTSGKTATIATNATNGWVAWVKSANAGLNSASTGASIPAAATANDNTATVLGTNKGYVVDVSWTDSATATTGAVSQASNYGMEFDGDGSTSGGSPETTFRSIAAADGITDGDTITLIERASISALQKAASDYTDTLTIIAAGRF